jgi:dihydroorotate dehydrogenase
MGVYEAILRPRLFFLTPETAHNLALAAISKGWVRCGSFKDSKLEQELFGVRFPNPLGLAAGFDKDGVACARWSALGFGFAEIGTVTPRAQPGNPKPRLFRLPKDGAIVNRLGFNSEGAPKVAERLRDCRQGLPIGVNIGKSHDTPLAEAAKDYCESFSLLKEWGAYCAINVSSPNTPGLRELQDKSALTDIVTRLQAIDASKPLLVKVSPDLDTTQLDEVISVAHDCSLAGLIATNTTLSREGLIRSCPYEGGLSGSPLKKRSNAVLSYLKQSCDPSMVLIGVGGIFGSADLIEKLTLGAHLCQVYTGWVYGGPQMACKAVAGLAKHMEALGLRDLAELRSSAPRHERG